MRSGLSVGVSVGVRQGVNVDAGGGGAPARVFPDSAAAWDTAFPSIDTPAAIWTFQAAASPIPDDVGSNDLVENQSLLYQQAGDPEGRLSLELDTTSANEFTGPASTTFGDMPAAQSWSLYVRWRMPDNAATARPVVNKGAGDPRWSVLVRGSGLAGGLQLTVLDTGAGSFTVQTANVYDDGNYHDTLFVYDQAAQLFHVITESEDVSEASTAFAGMAVATPIHFGAGGGLTALLGTRFSYAAFWAGVALTAADLATIRTPQ
jgi:hypothetical protein